MECGCKEFDVFGVCSVLVLKIGDCLMIGWNYINFECIYSSKD